MEDKQYTEQDYQSFFDLITPGATNEPFVAPQFNFAIEPTKKANLKYKFTCMCGR